jgi:hypothetical protein
MMDRYLWTDNCDDFSANKFDMILIGDESCGKILTSSLFLNNVSYLMESGIDFAVITPYLTPEKEERFNKFLKNLPKPAKIVVNDVGAFQTVKKSSHIPIIGRLLMRQNTDPSILSFYQDHPDKIIKSGDNYAILKHIPPSKTMTEHLKSSPLFSEEAMKIFAPESEKTAVIMDLLPYGMPEKIPERLSVILNTDNILISVLPCNSCHCCPAAETFIGMTRNSIPIYRKKNVCYYKRSDVSDQPPRRIPSYVGAIMHS